MIEDVESGKIGVCIMKDLTRWGRDYLQVGNAMEIFRRNNVRFIAVNNGIDSENPDTLEFAPFINIMSEWYAKDISKKVKTGIKTKGMSGKPIATEAPYGYVKSPDNKDFWIIDEEAAGVVRLIFRLFLDGKNRNQIAVYLTQAQIPTPTFYMKERGRGTCKNRALNEANRYKWNKATLTHILTRQEYCGDVVNFKTTKHFRDKRNHYVDRSQWQITENVHEPIIDRADFETAQRILENAPVRRPNGDGEIPVSYTHLDVYKRQALYLTLKMVECSADDSNESVFAFYLRDHILRDIKVFWLGHFMTARQIEPELVAKHAFRRERHFLMQDAAACGHPLASSVCDPAAVANAVAMLDISADQIGHGLYSAVRVPRKTFDII